MGRIKNKALYPLKASPTVDDYLIGTDFESGETVTFTVQSVSGEGNTVADNNKFVEVNYGKVVGDGITSPDVAASINSIPSSVEILFDEIPFFSGVVYDGVRSYYNTYVIVGKGKGIYGVGGNITVTNAELRIIASTLINNEDYVTPDPNAVLTDLGDITGTSLLDTLNAATPFVIAAGENRYWKYLDGGQEYIYGFDGAAGTYGAAQTTILITELFLVRDSASAIVSSTADLLNNGSDATSTYVEADELGAAAFDNDYNSLSNLPTIPAAITLTSELTNDGSDSTSTYVETDELGAAAFTNDYNDLTNIPTFGGLDNQIPFVNATNNGFEYSANFIYNGSKLHLLNVANSIEIGDYVGNVEGMQLTKNSLTFVDGNTVADIIVNSAGFKVDRYDTQVGAWYKNDSIVYKNAARTFEQTLVPATITATHTLTIPNVTDTIAVLGDITTAIGAVGLQEVTDIGASTTNNMDINSSTGSFDVHNVGFTYGSYLSISATTAYAGAYTPNGDSYSAVLATEAITKTSWNTTNFEANLIANATEAKLRMRTGGLYLNVLCPTITTSEKTQTFQDADGIIALTSDITGTNSGTNTGDQTSIVGITGTKAQFDTSVTDGNFMYIGDAPTAHTHPISTDITGLGTGVATSLAIANNAAGGYSPIDGAATLTNKTINFANNTLTNVMSLTTAQSVTAGIKKTFQANATNAGFRLLGVTADPSTLADGDIWFRSTLGELKYRENATVRTIAAVPKVLDNVTTTRNLVLADANQIVTLNNGAAVSCVIPANSSVAYPIGTKITLINKGAGVVTISITTDTLNGNVGGLTMAQYAKRTLIKITATSWILGY